MWTEPYCVKEDCAGGADCKQLRVRDGSCAFEYDPARYKEAHRWTGDGPPPNRWMAPDGTLVYRCYSDYLDD